MSWPMLLDMSRDDCKRLLRRLELEAYGSIVSAMRAQGTLSTEKRKLLQDLCASLNISMERHKAEIRRVANDERLATVAELMGGPNSTTDWAIEGRRLIPLLPRLVPQTAFTALANNVANITAAENATLPPPSQTVKTKDSALDLVSQIEPGIPEATKTSQRSASPLPTNHMMLPPGTSIRLKKDTDEEFKGKKRPKSSEGRPHSPKLPPVKMSIPPHQKLPLKTSYPVISSPIKITPLRSTAVTHSPATQKVIIVSSSATIGGSSNSSSILQRSLSGPLIKPSGSFSNVGQNLRGTPTLTLNNSLSNQLVPSTSSATNIVTISTNLSTNTTTNISTTASKVPFTGAPTAAYVGASSGVPRIRPMTLQLPARPRPRSSSIIIPTTPGVPSPQRANLQAVRPNLQPKLDTSNAKPIGISNTTKILPKPSFTPSSVSPMYVMSTATPAPITMITRAMPSNISPRINPTPVSSPPVIHSLPAVSGARHPFKTMQKVKVGVAPPAIRQSGGKTNVIVVQKGATSGYTRGVTLAQSVKKLAFSKPLASTPAVTIKKAAANVQPAAKPQAIQLPANIKPGPSIILLDMGKETFSKTSVLADIFQASGVPLKETSGEPTVRRGSASDQEPVTTQTGGIAIKNEGQQPTLRASPTIEEDIFGDTVGTHTVLPVQKEEDRTITIEEAVELLGHSDSPETRALLSQAGIEVRDHVPEQTLSTEIHTSVPQVVHEEDVVSADNDVMEVLGELDPQTGVYSIHSAKAGGSADSVVKDSPKQSSPPMDIFSTALASADINLDSFQYMDDGLDQCNVTSAGSTSTCEYPTFTEASLDQASLESASNQMEVEQQFELEESSEHNFEEFMQPTMESNAVMVEPSHMDTTEMYIEDFTSQKM